MSLTRPDGSPRSAPPPALATLPERPTRAEYDAWCTANQVRPLADVEIGHSYDYRHPPEDLEQGLEFLAAQRRFHAIDAARRDAAASPQAPTAHVDTYLTRKAQAAWPRAIVYAAGDRPAEGEPDTRPFRLSRDGQPDVILGEGGFRDARVALNLLTRAARE